MDLPIHKDELHHIDYTVTFTCSSFHIIFDLCNVIEPTCGLGSFSGGVFKDQGEACV